MTAKRFDAVKLMRELRDKLSQEMEGMSSRERLDYIRNKAASTPMGKTIAEHVNRNPQQADTVEPPTANR